MLPNFKRLMEKGIFSKNCITDFPSITYPTQQSIITGTYTGDYRKELCHGIPLSNWMNRNLSPPDLRWYGSNNLQIYKINEDLGSNCKTILEMIGEGNTTSIIQFISRGSNYFYPEKRIELIFFYFLLKFYHNSRNLIKLMTRANLITIKKLIEIFKRPKKYFGNKEPPIGILLYFFSSDILMHLFGYDSQIYKLNLFHIDKVMGILLNDLDTLGYLEETAIAIISDHGNYKAEVVGFLESFFNKNGLTHYHPRKNMKGNLNLAEFRGVGFFNFKGANNTHYKYSWTRPTVNELKSYGPKRVNLLEELFKIKGASLMFYREDYNTYNKGTIYLRRKDQNTGKICSGTIEFKGTGINYKTKYNSEDEDNDIFGFVKDEIASKLMDNKFHSINEWMNATHHLNYPLYPDLIPRHFKNPRSSDIILSTNGNVVFNYEHGKLAINKLYNHDIGLRKSAIVPLIIGGSNDIPHKEIYYCKITDIVPTLLKMIGKKSHKSVVGKCLI